MNKEISLGILCCDYIVVVHVNSTKSSIWNTSEAIERVFIRIIILI